MLHLVQAQDGPSWRGFRVENEPPLQIMEGLRGSESR